MNKKFLERLKEHYVVSNATDVSTNPETDFQTGSSHPENWQTDLQNGKSAEEIRQDALGLSGILTEWQNRVLEAQDYFKEFTANDDKYFHLYEPILVKGLSREKLESIAAICQKFAQIAKIV